MIRTNIEQMMAGQWFQVEEHEARLAELLAWQRETGKPLPMAADLILWLEDRGFVVDLLTGCTERLEPLQQLIDEAAATEDYEEYLADVEWLRSGC
jgi:hypothetical protein